MSAQGAHARASDADAVRAAAFAVFEEALAQPDEERTAWILGRCAGDETLQAAVQALVVADEQAAALIPSEGILLAVSKPAPERVGAFRVAGRLGAGGMGDVYHGVRDDGLFEHEVAIKLMRASMLPETSRALFERERRVLARLGHKNIARLFDGGVMDDGAPYFVLELVHGEPLDRHCVTRALTPEAIARLFIDVCDAVQFAHQNLVAHGDLKPANVLVEENGQPKVLDFGVARMLAEADAADAIYPRTLAYASPARLEGAAPTPADDIFALGVMLRETLNAARGGVRGDLAGVVERASAADPAARYATAAQLADDLRRWLEHRPLAHRARELSYSLGKFVRRRRLALSFGALALVGLIAALVMTYALYTAADTARARAEARFDDVHGLANYLLFDVYEQMADKPSSLQLRGRIAARAQGYLERLAADPTASDAVRRDVVEGLVRLAEIQAGPGWSHLGQTEAARENLDRAEALAVELAARAPNEALTLMRARIALRQAALDMNVDQNFDSAGAHLSAVDALLSQPSAANADAHAALSAEALVALSLLQQWRGEYQRAADTAAQAIAALAALSDDARAIAVSANLDLRAIDAHAEALYYADDRAGAERGYRRLVEATEVRVAERPGDIEAIRRLAVARWALGTTLIDRPGGAGEALAQLSQAVEDGRVLVAFEPMDESAQRVQRLSLAAYAQALFANGRSGEAITLMRAHLAERDALRQTRPHEAGLQRDYAIAAGMLADIYAQSGDAAGACPLYNEAIGVLERLQRGNALSALDAANALERDRQRAQAFCR